LGSDEIATATPAANAIPKADSAGKLAAGWLPVMSGKVKHTIQIPPVAIVLTSGTAYMTGAWSLPAGNSAVPGVQNIGTGGEQMRVGVLQFGIDVNRYALFRVTIPDDWDGSAITAKATAVVVSGSTGQTFKVGVNSFCSSGTATTQGTNLTAAVYTAGTVGTITLSAAPGGASYQYEFNLTVPISGCSPGNLLWGRMYRDRVNDTASSANLYITNVSLSLLGNLQ
jgi:hypothetical protein